jgi:hypothetical protein
MSPEPDLTSELDAARKELAEAIVTGRAETVVTEWGVRYDDLSQEPAVVGSGPDNERRARHEVACWPDGTLVRRTVTYGPWEEAPDGR